MPLLLPSMRYAHAAAARFGKQGDVGCRERKMDVRPFKLALLYMRLLGRISVRYRMSRRCARACQPHCGHLRERMNSLREAARPSARRAQRM